MQHIVTQQSAWYRPDIAMHRLRKVVKGEGLLFLLGQAPHCLWIEFAVLGFEGGQLRQGALLVGLSPDAHQFCFDFMAHSPGHSIQDVTLFVHQTALARGR